MFCRNCGAQVDEGAQFCIRCGANLRAEGATASSPQESPHPGISPTDLPPTPGPKQKAVSAVLAFLLGWLGVHRFYLGYHIIGAIQLTLTLLGFFTCGLSLAAAVVWGIVDGVLILTGSINTDAQGIPLRD